MISPTTADALRAHLHAQRLNVLTASAMALLFSAIGWGSLYGGLYWITMFVRTAIIGADATIPASFNTVMGACALTLMLVAAVEAYLHPHERAVDERPTIEHLSDILLFLPRLTLAMAQNFNAWPRLSAAEIPTASQLLDRLRGRSNVPLHTLPLDIPQDKLRRRVLVALQVAQLAGVRVESDTLILHIHPLAPATFRTPLPAPVDESTNLPKADESELPDAGRLME